MYLLGSRMRGDHGPDSNLDIALVGGPWRGTTLSGLPPEFGGVRTGWIPLNRSQFDSPPRVMGLPWVLVHHAVPLWKRALPKPPVGEDRRPLMIDFEHVRHNLHQAVLFVESSVQRLRKLHAKDGPKVGGARSQLALHSSNAAEFACKAALALRGIEPRHSHSAAALCADLLANDPLDPLLDGLLPLNGGTREAHVGHYCASQFSEPPERSAARAAGTLHAVAEIARELAPRIRSGALVSASDLRDLGDEIRRIPASRQRRRFEEGLRAVKAANRTQSRPR